VRWAVVVVAPPRITIADKDFGAWAGQQHSARGQTAVIT
jgi:hypothetical protein